LARLGRWVAVVTLGLIVGILLCSLIPANEFSKRTAERARCASNLHQIGLAIQEYYQSHGGNFPDTLAQIIAGPDGVDGTVLICPTSTDTPAAVPATTMPTTGQAIGALASAGHDSYVYCSCGWTDRSVPPDAIVAYEPVSHHGVGSYILFGDAHAEWISMPRAARLIAAATATTRPVSAAAVP
jgi:type II secretory pathway pseudopilin PulG